MKRQIKIKLYCDIELFKISLAIQMKEKYSLLTKKIMFMIKIIIKQKKNYIQ